MEYKHYKFKDICIDKGMIRGPFGSALKKSLFVPKGEDTYKVYEQCVPLEQDKNKGNYYISGDYFRNSLKRFEVRHNDFLVSCSGVNYGAIYHLQEPFEKGVINQALLIIRINSEIVDYYYFKYLFNYVLSKAIIASGSDSTIPNFPSMDIIKDVDVFLPPLSEQKQIGKALYTVDKKISLNKKINDNLYEIAHTYYMHHFFSKSANGTIEDILVENAKSPIKVGEAKNSNGIYPFFTSGDAILRWSEYMIDGRNCYLNTGGNAGIKFYVGKAAYSTDTWCVTGKNNYSDYLFLLLDSIMLELDKKFFQGTGLKHLQKPLLKNKPIYVPMHHEINEFNNNIVPLLSIVSKNIKESQQLTMLRDWLLPMLMNGQATVSD